MGTNLATQAFANTQAMQAWFTKNNIQDSQIVQITAWHGIVVVYRP